MLLSCLQNEIRIRDWSYNRNSFPWLIFFRVFPTSYLFTPYTPSFSLDLTQSVSLHGAEHYKKMATSTLAVQQLHRPLYGAKSRDNNKPLYIPMIPWRIWASASKATGVPKVMPSINEKSLTAGKKHTFLSLISQIQYKTRIQIAVCWILSSLIFNQVSNSNLGLQFPILTNNRCFHQSLQTNNEILFEVKAWHLSFTSFF